MFVCTSWQGFINTRMCGNVTVMEKINKESYTVKNGKDMANVRKKLIISYGA